MIHRILGLMLVLIMSAISIFGQGTGELKGFIIDGETSEGLIGANVYLKGSTQGASCDFTGAYAIRTIDAGTQTFVVSYIGYNTVEQEIEIVAGQTTTFDFNLVYETLTGVEVIITAQAEAQIAAINQQLAASTITNIVSAKKIQENPDANAAEAIGRLPGVSISRSGGEGTKVSVRGLSPKFNKVSIEGVSMASTGGDDRSVDLSMISPYMLEGIELSKAALPDREADVIGGGINFVLRQAPDKNIFDVLAQFGYGSLKNRFGDYKFVLGASRRFLDNKLGFFVQADVEKRNRDSYDYNANFFHTTSPENSDDVDVSLFTLQLSDYQREVKRLGGVIVIDYQLPNGKIKFSTLSSSIANNSIIRSEIHRPFFTDHFYRYQDIESDLNVMTNSLRIENNFGPILLDFGFSRAYSKNVSPKGALFEGTELSAYQLRNENGDPLLLTYKPERIASFALNNVNAAFVSKISKANFNTEEVSLSSDINLTYEKTFSKKITAKFKTGLMVKKLTKENDFNSERIQVAWGGQGGEIRKLIVERYPEMQAHVSENVSQLPYSLFIDKSYKPVELGDNLTIQNVPDSDLVNGVLEVAEGRYFPDYPQSKMRDYSGDEFYSAGYAMVDINFGKKIQLIPGFRIENNTTDYTASRGNSGAKEWYEGYIQHDTTIHRTNRFFLPMVHLKYKPIDWFDVRLAYTQTLARPNFNEITPFWNRTLNEVFWNNPFLEPSLSNNFDIYGSFYNNKLGLFTIGGFYKSIDKLIFAPGTESIIDPSEFGLPENTKGKIINRKINNPRSAKLSGIELEWQTRFWYVDNFMKGLILNVNFTHTRSEVEYPRTLVETTYLMEAPWIQTTNIDTFYVDRLVSQPDNIFNITLGYDYKGLSTRLSMVYQDNIFVQPNFYNRLRTITDKSIRFDFSLKQNLPYKGLELFMNLSNITDAVDRTLNLGTSYSQREQHYGSKIDFGIRYRLK